MATYEVNDDISPFNRVVFIRNRWGDEWYTGSGTIVGNNDILTASHVVYNEGRGGWSDECRIYPSYDPDSSSLSSGYYLSYYREGHTSYNSDDGRGDNKSGSLAGRELDIAFIALDTNIDAMAISVGNIHLQENNEGGLDEDRIRAIEKVTDIPLVIHGGSGVPVEQRTYLSQNSL